MAVLFDASVLIDLFNKRLAGERRIEPFDKRAALECALQLEEAWTRGQQSKVTHTKFKFDWQIVAIAASRNVTAIYSDDADVARAASRIGIPVYDTNSLPLPASAMQSGLPFDKPDDDASPNKN